MSKKLERCEDFLENLLSRNPFVEDKNGFFVLFNDEEAVFFEEIKNFLIENGAFDGENMRGGFLLDMIKAYLEKGG